MHGIKYLIRKGGVYMYRRKVPHVLSDLEPRKFIKVSLGTKDLAEAATRIKEVNKETEMYFATISQGGDESVRINFDKAVKRARYFGLVYRSAQDISEGPLEEIQKRLNLAEQHLENPAAIEAILGGADKPEILLSNCLEIYFEIEKRAIIGKSEDQIRRWRNPRAKAIENMKALIGDKQINLIDRDDTLTFRDYWLDRINDEDLTPNSANKDFGHLRKVIRLVCEHHRIPYTNVFAELNFPENQKTFKQAFETSFILDELLADDALIKMPLAGRKLIELMSETGARPSELIPIDPKEELHLDNKIPYIQIRRNRYRTIKNRNSERELPLVGYALKAAQDGVFDLFEPYRHKSISLTNLVGQYFRNKGTMPSERHTLYSLRHAFSDRLVAHDAPERVKAELMGHTYSKPTYGQGQALAKRLEWMNKISLPK